HRAGASRARSAQAGMRLPGPTLRPGRRSLQTAPKPMEETRSRNRDEQQAEDAAPSPIHVTRTFLPPREEYLHWLDKAYGSRMLTNNGPIHRELEETLRLRFQVPHLKLMANGTLALQLALRALGVKGQ